MFAQLLVVVALLVALLATVSEAYFYGGYGLGGWGYPYYGLGYGLGFGGLYGGYGGWGLYGR